MRPAEKNCATLLTKRKELIIMPIEPTLYEVIATAVLAVAGWVWWFWVTHRNEYYDPKHDDPYRYCPKDYDTMGE